MPTTDRTDTRSAVSESSDLTSGVDWQGHRTLDTSDDPRRAVLRGVLDTPDPCRVGSRPRTRPPMQVQQYESSERHQELDHELRGALFGIGASAEVLSKHRQQLTDQQFDELARGLAAEVRRLRTLLDGRIAVPRPFDLGEAIRPVIACARASGLDVLSYVPSGIAVHGIRDTTAQVVLGLFDNAGKHTSSSPIDVRARELCGSTALYVEDRGSGVVASLRPRVFERGVCLDDRVGSGLGLFVARRLMIEQGGSIAVRSRPGGGSTFVLHFRRALGVFGSNAPRETPAVRSVLTARLRIVEDHVPSPSASSSRCLGRVRGSL